MFAVVAVVAVVEVAVAEAVAVVIREVSISIIPAATGTVGESTPDSLARDLGGGDTTRSTLVVDVIDSSPQ